MDDRIDAIDERLTRIEKALTAHGLLQPSRVVARDIPAPSAKPTVHTDIPEPSNVAQVASEQRPLETERFVGGRILLAVGAIALLLGVAFFLKYAFDNGWIGPTGRVALGMIAGALLLVGSERLRPISHRAFSEGVTALGAGVLYLSLWAAGNGFHLVPIPLAFLGMALVTALLILLAVRRDSEITATWGLIGGFMTPILNATETPAYLSLYSYLAILDAAIIFLPRQRTWARVAPIAFFLTQCYLFQGIFEHSLRLENGTSLGPSLGLLIAAGTLYLALFMYRPVAKALRHEPYDVSDLVLVLLCAVAYYGALHAELYDEHRTFLIGAVVALAIAYLMLAYIDKTTRAIYAGIALALITGGVAITFSGDVITSLWAIEGALLAWTGITLRLPIVRIFALVAFVCAGIHLAIDFPLGGPLFANERFFTLIICGASLAAARIASLRTAQDQTGFEAQLYRIAEVAAHVCVVASFSAEFWTWSSHNELALTLFWLLYGSAVLAVGFARNSLFVRLEGLGFIALAVAKAFLVDMSTVDPGIRIISFLALGGVLLTASYWYLRVRRPNEERSEP